MKKLALVAMVGLGALIGCDGNGMNSPFKKYTKEEQLAATASRGYTEIKRENVIYVASTPDGVKRVKEGKEPPLAVSAVGFGPNGEKVVFEGSKDGLENGLMAEFEKRHGGAEAAAAAEPKS